LNAASLVRTSEVDAQGELNRHAALGALNDRINIEGLGHAEWFKRTKPNNSLNPTGMSMAFIENLPHDAGVSRQVNSSVRFLLNDETQRSASIFTSPEWQSYS